MKTKKHGEKKKHGKNFGLKQFIVSHLCLYSIKAKTFLYILRDFFYMLLEIVDMNVKIEPEKD